MLIKTQNLRRLGFKLALVLSLSYCQSISADIHQHRAQHKTADNLADFVRQLYSENELKLNHDGNTLWLRAKPDVLQEAKNLILKIDQKPKAIQIQLLYGPPQVPENKGRSSNAKLPILEFSIAEDLAFYFSESLKNDIQVYQQVSEIFVLQTTLKSQFELYIKAQIAGENIFLNLNLTTLNQSKQQHQLELQLSNWTWQDLGPRRISNKDTQGLYSTRDKQSSRWQIRARMIKP